MANDTTLNRQIIEVKNKTLNITNVATAAALTRVENKIPNVSDLVKKTDYNTLLLIMTMINILLLKNLIS